MKESLKSAARAIDRFTSPVRRWRVYICGMAIAILQILQSAGVIHDVKINGIVSGVLAFLTILFRMLSSGPAPGYKEIFSNEDPDPDHVGAC